ncbi:hypothetical protein [Massilia yuzhufengensis]|uniref:Uncharacterized protein n=1 Tax=Massilia yuzhufengensis TaxID=1164594 RepID=A0A1I1D9W6_9BURK|nr:hypothetical protein [Massilia yuzhufengensis]SFB71735.1 hypothetical protein SAMN05216204_10199 [Massilia yuzhufengensis]
MTTTTTTAPARLNAEWLKVSAIILTTFVVCWTIVVWYWNTTEHNPGTRDLVLALVILPAGLLLAFWGGRKVLAARVALPAASASKPASSAPANASMTAPVLAIVATALRSPHGASADELASAIADNDARADLDKELVDDNGFPVMTARTDNALHEALQDEIAEWLSGQGMRLHLSDEQWRALILATNVAGELASLASGNLMPAEGKPPLLQLKLLLPQDWSVELQRAATMWLKHTVSQYGWPEASIAVPDATAQDMHTTPAATLSQLMSTPSTHSAPTVAIVIACASLIGQESIDRLAANSSLFTSSQSRGQIPGEGAAGLLLTDLQQAQACGSGFALLGPVDERRRDTSADDTKRVDATMLLDMAEQACKASAIDASQVAMVVADTVHRPNRVLELMGLGAPALPQVDAADDIVRIGLGLGSCGAVPFITALALAQHYALERGAPVFCIGNEDPFLRSVTLVRPPA